MMDQKDKRVLLFPIFFFNFHCSFFFFLFAKLFVSCKRPSKLYSLQVPKIDRRLVLGYRVVCAGECKCR